MFKFRPDWFLILPAFLLMLISLTIIRSVAPDLIFNQILFIIIGSVFFLIFAAIDYEVVFSLHFFSYIFFLLLSVITAFFGVLSRGSQRWLMVGQFTFQPSEVIKPFLLVTFSVLAVSSIRYRRLWLVLAGIIPILVIYLQPDLGTSLVIFVGWASIILSRMSLKSAFLIIALLSLIIVPVYKYVLHDYQRTRLMAFFNPYSDPLGNGYHVIQSTIAVGSGELAGRGLGRGTQTQLKFLPEHHTDFIFASISEELGFVGSATVVFLFGVIYWRIYKISQDTLEPKASIFCLASLALLGFQTFINIAMNLGIAPITGITLPLISAGGSSLLSVAINLGIINSISSNLKNTETLRIA
jgi:rod shape determining protein RodA